MSSNNKKLDPCPFCGSSNTSVILGLSFRWHAGCHDCGCRTGEYNHSVDAITAWNRRAGIEEPEEDEAVDAWNERVSDGE